MLPAQLARFTGIRNSLAQAAETLVAHAIEQLIHHLLVRPIIELLQFQYPHHRFGRKRRSAALLADWSRCAPIDIRHQGCNVDVLLDLGEWLAQAVDRLPT